MRTKTLLLTAALSAAGVATSMAQVYSVNAVGYVNRTAAKGFSILANPLDDKNGNKISNVITGVPDGFTVYTYSSAGFGINSFSTALGWDDPDQVLAPGTGAFVNNPTAAAITITFVGEVPQGTLTTALPANFSLVASKVPQAGLLSTDLKYTPADGDTVYIYHGGYLISSYDGTLGEWDAEPVLEVAEGFYLFKKAAGSWTRTFSVN